MRWNQFGLQLRLQILIQGFLLVILLASQTWISSQISARSMRAAQDRSEVVGDGVINALNTLMATTVDGNDVISDAKVRDMFIRKMGASDNLKEVRVFRGKGVIDEFGAGAPSESPVDAIDHDVLNTGKPVFKIDHEAGTLRAVLPYIAHKEFRGSRCLGCHGVDEGSVLGAVSVTSDIKADQENIHRINMELWFGQVLMQILLFFVIHWIVKRQLRELGAEPREATLLAQRVAAGDLSTAIPLQANDSSSMMAQLDLMQSSLSALVSKVRRSSESVAIASTEIAQGNNNLSSRTEQQASALQQTAAAMDELGSTVSSNADSARSANQLATDAAQVAVRGGEVVGQVVVTMKDISAASHKISDIISVIDGIAFQTNILALNAAVEAARAGEQGRGFAVVASEVRSLAGRSATAAHEIKALINSSLEKVEQGTAQVDRAGATMNDIVSAIQRVSEIMHGITAASSEQATGVAQVGHAIAQMDETTQQNAALVEQMAASASSLNQLAQELVHTVAVFRLEADGQSAGGHGLPQLPGY